MALGSGPCTLSEGGFLLQLFFTQDVAAAYCFQAPFRCTRKKNHSPSLKRRISGRTTAPQLVHMACTNPVKNPPVKLLESVQKIAEFHLQIRCFYMLDSRISNVITSQKILYRRLPFTLLTNSYIKDYIYRKTVQFMFN